MRQMARRALQLTGSAALLLCAALALPDPAAACSVCTGGDSDQVRYAFVWTTVFLSVVPLGMIGGLIWFIRRRARELAERRAPPADAALSRSAASR
jgi:hypothetical protein